MQGKVKRKDISVSKEHIELIFKAIDYGLKEYPHDRGNKVEITPPDLGTLDPNVFNRMEIKIDGSRYMLSVFQPPHTQGVLDLGREYRWLGPKDPVENDYVWALQDGMIFTWSESNSQYEVAWWLTAEGLPTSTESSLIRSLCQTRPFDPEWLK